MKVKLKKDFTDRRAFDDWDYLLQHFLITGLNASSDYDRRRRAAEAFLDRCRAEKREVSDTLSKPVIFSTDDFEFIPGKVIFEQYVFLLGFHNFGVAVRDILNNYAPPSNGTITFERLDSPPAEAYIYRGNNDLPAPCSICGIAAFVISPILGVKSGNF